MSSISGATASPAAAPSISRVDKNICAREALASSTTSSTSPTDVPVADTWLAPMRRALEAQSPEIETLGFAGFFGASFADVLSGCSRSSAGASSPSVFAFSAEGLGTRISAFKPLRGESNYAMAA